MAVEAVLKIIDPEISANVDLKDIKLVKKLRGTIDDTQLVYGIFFDKWKPSSASGGPTKIQNAKSVVVQLHIVAPKTDLEDSVIANGYQVMNRIMKGERKIIAEMVKNIVASDTNVFFMQKNILKETISELSLYFLAKKGIMVV